ncbi:MAG TPA: MBL fold metallo-hydrolase [Gemmatimonadales bacterium]|nr:MBL fold metallo-hydrolase [Gemmatimonadales bacterium]
MPTGPEAIGITTGSFQQTCWLLVDPAAREAVVVDPGEGSAAILGEVRARGLRVTGIWLTHAHIDHIWGVDDVRLATGAPVWLHPLDRRWYDILPEQGRMFGLDGLPRLAPPDHELAHGQTLSVGRFDFAVRHVPGHAPGHVAFIGHGLAVSGDVLFAGSIGRTDLAGGDLSRLLQSIRDELLTLPDATRVLPGHGPETTVGAERAANPFLR